MPASSPDRRRVKHRFVAVLCGALVGLMVSLAYASVPLYRMFCQATGYAGTTRRAAAQSANVGDAQVTVRFDANVAPGLAWRFEPVTKPLTVRLGETAVAVYRATSTANVPTTGTAAYNVVPDLAGSYFNKLACFCFTEQTLQPGQTAELPVQFFVDPAMARDSTGRRITEITLSYTFFPVAAQPTIAAKKGLAVQTTDAKRDRGS